jgi:hypothetical protein
MDKPNDIIHRYIPEIPAWTNDITVVITIILLFVNRKKVRLDKMLVTLTAFYMVRLVFVMSTTLPRVDGTNGCKESDHLITVGDCTDYFFSGHTLFNVVATYNIGAPVFPLWSIVTSVITAASREHYTIDVLMPWVMLGLATAPALR